MKLTQKYFNRKCKQEFYKQRFRRINERSIEYKFVFQSLVKISPNSILDVGTGTTALPSLLRTCGFLVTAIDNIKDYWTKGMFNRHYYVIYDDITDSKLNKEFDFIVCISVLEHIENYNAAIKNLLKLLKKDGHLVLTFPYNENFFIENVYKLPGAGYGQNWPWICRVFSREQIDEWIETFNGKIIEQEFWQIFTGKYWTFGDMQYPPKQSNKEELHHLLCLLIQKL